ncbi:transposase-like protein%2C IS1381 ISSpn7 [Streptococcus pneumoniae]|nr:transposase-like protein%2C IS1381 ISSpn7 [Streptococcus pneumoniae]
MADSGYQGLMKIYPQAQTPRKSSKLKPLTAEDKTYNHALSKERSKVENIFAKVKTFKMFSTTYRNHRKRFGLRMNLIAGKVVVVRLEKPVTFHNMIAPDKEVEVSLLFFIINNSSSSQTNILAQLMDFFTGNGHLEDLSKISEPEKLYAYIAEATA